MHCHIGMAVAAAATFISFRAEAQEYKPPCIVKAPSFQPSPENQMKRAQVDALYHNQRLVFLRPSAQHPSCELRFTSTGRGDGSVASTCQYRCIDHRGTKDYGPWQNCPEGSARDVGVAKWEGDTRCIRQLTVAGTQEACGSYHQLAGQYAFRWVKGRRTCMEGDFIVEPR
jgi:hypothetical protein